jgi:DNA-binding NtrC family response regulator
VVDDRLDRREASDGVPTPASGGPTSPARAPGPGRTRGADRFLGTSRAAARLRATIRLVAAGPARVVLLRGESGTGKGLVARALHEEARGIGRPFVSILCSALPETLLETELFGHEPGAYTDARRRKPGLLECVEGGTLLLDEVGDMPLALQAKVLGVLEDRRFRRLGGIEELEFRGRLVAATHRDLDVLVAQGTFRADLLYRLRVVPVDIPPLRERPEDVPVLVRHFAGEIAEAAGRPAPSFTPEALEVLSSRLWPGNAREVRNVVERILSFADGDPLGPERIRPEDGAPTGHLEGIVLPPQGLDVEGVIDALVRQAWERTAGNQSAMSRLLHLGRDRIRRRLDRLGIPHHG